MAEARALRAESIKATGGELFAHVFQNPNVGVARGLFWILRLQCEPIVLGDEEWEVSVGCEWLTWPLADWTGLDGMQLADVLDPDSVECSIYLSEHHEVRLQALRMERVVGTPRFRVELRGEFDLEGFDDLDAQGVAIRVQADVDFTGVVVLPANLTPKPSTPAEVVGVVGAYLSTANLGEPAWDRFRYVLAPVLG